jgi:hypothetical protein
VLVAGYLPLVAAAIAAAGAAEAETKAVEIQLDGPEGCSGADAFFGFVRSRTQRVRRAEVGEPRTTLQVRLSRGHGNVVGELRMVDDRGGTDTRKVQGASCDEVVQALSLTAALALDPAALLTVEPGAAGAAADAAATAAQPADAASTAKVPAAPPDATLATPPAPKPRPLPGFEMGVGPLALAMLSGSMSPGIALAARKTLGKEGAFTPTLGLALAYVRNDVLQSPQDAQVALAGMGASVCPVRLAAGILTLQPCALALGGWLSATGRQATYVSTADRLWLSAGAAIRIAAFLGRGFSLELEGGFTAPLWKRRFFYANEPTNIVAETPTISPIVGLGLTYGL